MRGDEPALFMRARGVHPRIRVTCTWNDADMRGLGVLRRRVRAWWRVLWRHLV